MSILSNEDKIKILTLAKDAVIQITPEVALSKPSIEHVEEAYRKFKALITGEEKPTKK